MRKALAAWVVVAAVASGATAWAADWTSNTLDDGAWFQAQARSADGSVEVACGGRSLRGLTAESSQVRRPVLTRPGEMRLSLAAKLFVGAPPPELVRVRVNRLEYALSAARYDAPRRAFVLAVRADNPVFEALAQVNRFTVVPEDAGPIPVAKAAEMLAAVIDFCQVRWAEQEDSTPASPERTKALAFAAAQAGGDVPEIRRLEMVDLNRDGVPEAFLILGGKFCGARLCDGYVLDLSGEDAKPLGNWAIATLRPSTTMLNGWRDLEVNGSTLRYLRGRYRRD
ncbi:MAG: hypothetical protein AAF674_16210 [Pseudomonadota bacterium]